MDAHHEREHEKRDTEIRKHEDLNAEAIKEGTTPEHIREHGAQPHTHSGKAADQQTEKTSGHGGSDRLVDGYAMTEGDDYAQPQRDETEGYDPTHSGVRHAPNKPGAPTNAPGRDEGTAWSEQAQNGKTTDAPGRKNPAD